MHPAAGQIIDRLARPHPFRAVVAARFEVSVDECCLKLLFDCLEPALMHVGQKRRC